MLAPWARAAVAAGLIAFAYTAGGLWKAFAGVILLAVLLTPVGGESMAAGLVNWLSARLRGE